MTKPKFLDRCEHGIEYFVGSTTLMKSAKNQMRVDVYAFPSSLYGTAICIRYGNEGSKYISPGGIVDFIKSNSYKDVLLLLEEKGKFIYIKNKE
jgi:hypothetical protein